MKVFEYLACGRVILSSRLPVLEEVLNDQNSLLLPPDDLLAWESAIRQLIVNPDLRSSLAAQARRDAMQYSWQQRASRILSGLRDSAQTPNQVGEGE
jgi:glycosyltransferase involved in cell wall biosynthesis